MPKDIKSEKEIHVGDFFEECFWHPCLCKSVDGDDVDGISLVDGSIPRRSN